MKVKYLFISLVFGLLVVPAVASAQDQTDPMRLEVEKRVSERKSRVKPELPAAAKTHLQDRCKGAQTKLATLAEIAQKHSERRDKKTTELIDRVNKIVEQQKSDGQDTSKIDSALVQVNEQSKAVQTAYQNYSLALSDAAKLDCKADSEGFKASLEDARAQFNALKEARKKLHDVMKQVLQPALKEFHTNIKKDDS